MLFVPERFAHGFITLQDTTDVFYQMSAKYVAGAEGAIRWNDPAIAIKWPLEPTLLSTKDRNHPDFRLATVKS
jgi:dTDP-4-dehydrorhamnose 3,5-epimerase